MKKILLTITLLLPMFFFSGCVNPAVTSEPTQESRAAAELTADDAENICQNLYEKVMNEYSYNTADIDKNGNGTLIFNDYITLNATFSDSGNTITLELPSPGIGEIEAMTATLRINGNLGHKITEIELTDDNKISKELTGYELNYDMSKPASIL